MSKYFLTIFLLFIPCPNNTAASMFKSLKIWQDLNTDPIKFCFNLYL